MTILTLRTKSPEPHSLNTLEYELANRCRYNPMITKTIMALKIALALKALHEQGLTHGDVCESNIHFTMPESCAVLEDALEHIDASVEDDITQLADVFNTILTSRVGGLTYPLFRNASDTAILTLRDMISAMKNSSITLEDITADLCNLLTTFDHEVVICNDEPITEETDHVATPMLS